MIEADDFRTDAYGWLTNQCGHFAIGIAMAGFGLPLMAVPVLYWLVSEVLLQRLALWRDGLVDTAHVAMGAAVLLSADPRPWLLLWSLTLAGGVWRRLK